MLAASYSVSCTLKNMFKSLDEGLTKLPGTVYGPANCVWTFASGGGGMAPLPASLLYSMPVPSCSVFPSVKVALPELPAIAGIALPMLVFVIVVVPTLPVPDNKPIRSVLLCALMAQATHLPPVVLPLTLCRCRAHHALCNPVLLCLLHLLPVLRPLVLV